MAYIEIDPNAEDEDLASNVRKVLDEFEWTAYCDDELQEFDAYEHMRRGKCMLCGSTLKAETMIVVGPPGVLGLWCDSECFTDQAVMGFLQQVLNDYIEQYEIKGKEHDQG